jgi:hypothetical protein
VLSLTQDELMLLSSTVHTLYLLSLPCLLLFQTMIHATLVPRIVFALFDRLIEVSQTPTQPVYPYSSLLLLLLSLRCCCCFVLRYDFESLAIPPLLLFLLERKEHPARLISLPVASCRQFLAGHRGESSNRDLCKRGQSGGGKQHLDCYETN